MNTVHGIRPDDNLGELLRDEPFLRRLALRLVGDSATADDLVQDTWLEVLRRRPSAGEGLRAWSEIVLRRLAGKRLRGARRRESREAHVARDEVQPDPLAEVERRLDVQTTLVAALKRISPEQREALVLRHSHELSLAEIAARQRTSVANVKARLVRGLAALRTELQSTQGRDGALGVFLAPLLRPRLEVSSVASLFVPVFGGLFALAHSIKLGAVAVAVIALAFVSLRTGSGPEVRTEPQMPQSDALSDVVHDGAREQVMRDDPQGLAQGLESPRVAAKGAASASAAAPAPLRALVVRVASPRSVEARVSIIAESADGTRNGPVLADERVSAPGVLRLSLAELVTKLDPGFAPSALRVWASADGCSTATGLVSLEASAGDQDLTVTLTLRETAFLTGRFEGLAGARTFLHVYPLVDGVPGEQSLARGVVDPADGSFRFGVEHDGEVALALPVRGMRSWSSVVTLVPGRTLDLGLIELTEPGARISGEVRAGAGPAGGIRLRFELVRPGTRVECVVVEGPGSLLWEHQSFVVATVTVAADDAGRFSVGGLKPGLHRVTLQPPSRMNATWGGAPAASEVHAPAEGVVLDAQWAHLELTLDVPDDLTGVGMLYTGEPGWTPQGSGLSGRSLREDPVVRVALSPGVATEARVEFAGYEPVLVEACATRAGEVVRRTGVLRRPGGSIRLILTVTGAAEHDLLPMLLLDGAVSDRSDPGASLLTSGPPQITVASAGKVTFDGVPGGKRTLRLVPGAKPSERIGDLADALLELDLPWSGEHHATVALERGCRLRVRVLQQDGTPIDAHTRIVSAGGTVQPALFVARVDGLARATSTTGVNVEERTDGWNEVVPNLPPGDYVLHVDVEGQARREVPFRLERGVPNEVTVQL